MASGSKKDNDSKVQQNTSNAIAALKPKNYADPYGTVTHSKKATTFTPVESDIQRETRGTIDNSINSIVSQVPTEFDIDSYYNNPFYETTKRMYQRVIDQQRERDDRDLTNNLNARNQMGSSYDALARRYMAQDYNSRYDQADDQARMASANAYQQAYQNLLESLRGLSNERSTSLERAYAPAKIAMGYQSALSPLQTGAANAYMGAAGIYGQRPTGGGGSALGTGIGGLLGATGGYFLGGIPGATLGASVGAGVGRAF